MAQLRNLKVGAINIVFHDRELHNDEEQYVRLLKLIFERQHPVNLGGHRYILMGLLERETASTLIGTFDKYIEIEPTGWWNRQTRQPASEDEIRSIQIPPDLTANHRSFPLLFDARIHRLAFLVGDTGMYLNPRDVQRYLRAIVGDGEITDAFGDISIHIEQEPGALARILDAPFLRQLVIEVEVPNTDVDRDS